MKELQPNDLRFSLFIDGELYYLDQSPNDWEETEISYEKSTTYSGLVRSFSFPLEFVLRGAKLIRKKLYTNGIEGVAMFRAELLNRSKWEYELFYEGDLDLSTAHDVLNGLEVNIMEGGLSAKIKAYEGVKYEIPLDDPEVITIRLPGIDKTEKATLIPYRQGGLGGTAGYFPAIEIITNSMRIGGTAQASSGVPLNGSPGEIPSGGSGAWFFSSRLNADLYGTFSMSGSYKQAGDGSYIIIIMNSEGVEKHRFFDTVDDPDESIFTINPLPFIFPVVEGEVLYLRIFYSGSYDPSIVFNIDSSLLELNIDVVTQPSLCKALKPKVLMDRLIEKMNGIPVSSVSQLLGNEWDNLVVTCGDGIRELPEAKIKSSFTDFFTSINSVLCAGFALYNNVPTLESKDFFFDESDEINDLGEIVDFENDPADNYLYNSIKIGYPNKDYEQINGREEYNSEQIYSTPVTRVTKELNLLSVYRADQYGIESVRLERDELNENNTDKSADNDTFFIVINKEPGVDGIYDIYGDENYLVVEGISNRNKSYNLSISPKKNLLRHSKFLKSFLFGVNGEITFASATKNSDLVTEDLEGNVVDEGANVPISSLGTPYFLPFLASVNTDLPINIKDLIESNSNGVLRFTYLNKQFTGFIVAASIDLAKNSEREFKLLLSPSNNLLNLVH